MTVDFMHAGSMACKLCCIPCPVASYTLVLVIYSASFKDYLCQVLHTFPPVPIADAIIMLLPIQDHKLSNQHIMRTLPIPPSNFQTPYTLPRPPDA